MLTDFLTVETQDSIEEWACEVFGPPTSLPLALSRANLEMAELVKATIAGVASADEIADEAADVFITLTRPAKMAGEDLTPVMRIVTPAPESTAASATRANGVLGYIMTELAEGRDANPGIYIGLIATRLAQLTAKLGIPLCLAVDRKMTVNRVRHWKIDATGLGRHVDNQEAAA